MINKCILPVFSILYLSFPVLADIDLDIQCPRHESDRKVDARDLPEDYKKSVKWSYRTYSGLADLTRAFLALNPELQDSVFDEYVGVVLSVSDDFKSRFHSFYNGYTFHDLCYEIEYHRPNAWHSWIGHEEKHATLQSYIASAVVKFAALPNERKIPCRSQLLATLTLLISRWDAPFKPFGMGNAFEALGAAMSASDTAARRR